MAEQWVITKLDELTKAHAALTRNIHTMYRKNFDRIEQLAERIAALEPPATPAPDPVCQCGHPKSNHSFGEHPGSPCIGAACHCRSFRVPTEQPDPAPLDPVLPFSEKVMLRAANHLYSTFDDPYEREQSFDDLPASTRMMYVDTVHEIVAILTGRDGAR